MSQWQHQSSRLSCLHASYALTAMQDREYYARRKDKLREKRRYYDSSGLLQSFVEHYDCGSAYGVRTLWQYFSVNDDGESVLVRQVCHIPNRRGVLLPAGSQIP